ncbi:MAG: hypothetical protein M3N54_00165 [Acidobacteriota bacterium]|nr:hypothetical protein [Acidobacteriota bacterium]
MESFTRRSGVRRAVLAIAPAALGARLLSAQIDATQVGQPPTTRTTPSPDETRLPNGKLQRDEILRADYQQNLKDARELMNLSKTFELELEKSDRFVLSVDLLKRLDDMEKLTKRIRTRMRR